MIVKRSTGTNSSGKDNIMPEQPQTNCTYTDRTTKGQLRRQQCGVLHYRCCTHTKRGINTRVPMNG